MPELFKLKALDPKRSLFVLVVVGIFVFISATLTACASSGSQREFIPELDSGSTASGAAYTADGMHFRKKMPLHKDWRPLEFYFKHCADIGEKPYFPKTTTYECTAPY